MTHAADKAMDLYVEFHQFEPERVGNFHRGFSIPDRANYVGHADVMYYASDKLNPTTGEDEGLIHYFHEHDKGVRLYRCDDDDGEPRNMPPWVYKAPALWRIGTCEGFEYTDFDGKRVEAKTSAPHPEWYAVPSGKALLVVQSKRTVLAILWGGNLHVEWRGVVG